MNEWLKMVGSQESHTIEKLMEHIFLAEVLQECWFRRRQVVEVLRAEVDAAGYDLVLESGGSIRHVQLKASRKGAKTSSQSLNVKLPEREGGCAVWVIYSVNEEDCRARLTYRWWDSRTKELPLTPHKHAGKTRENTRVLKKSAFDRVSNTSELVDLLFG